MCVRWCPAAERTEEGRRVSTGLLAPPSRHVAVPAPRVCVLQVVATGGLAGAGCVVTAAATSSRLTGLPPLSSSLSLSLLSPLSSLSPLVGTAECRLALPTLGADPDGGKARLFDHLLYGTSDSDDDDGDADESHQEEEEEEGAWG